MINQTPLTIKKWILYNRAEIERSLTFRPSIEKSFSFFTFFPEPEQIDGWALIKGENNGREDEPVDIEVKDEEENEGCNSSQRGHYGSGEKEM